MATLTPARVGRDPCALLTTRCRSALGEIGLMMVSLTRKGRSRSVRARAVVRRVRLAATFH